MHCPEALVNGRGQRLLRRREEREDAQEDGEDAEAQQMAGKQEREKATLQRMKAKKPRLIF